MKKTLVIHGREDAQGRALFVVSALYHCVEAFREHAIEFIDVNSIAVEIAVQVLVFDTGLAAACVAGPAESRMAALRPNDFFVAVALDDALPARRLLEAAPALPHLIALQFPSYEQMDADLACRLAASHNPREFAALLQRRVR